MSELRSHPHLTLAQHLEQIRAAVVAIRARHSRRLLEVCAEAWGWLESAIRLHDAGKGSKQFQEYIRDPKGYLRRRPGGGNTREMKSHTPLSTAIALALARKEGWDWQRAFAVAQIVRGHHSGLEVGRDFVGGYNCCHLVLTGQVPGIDWKLLGEAIGWDLSDIAGLTAEDFTDDGADQLDTLFDEVGRSGTVRFRLLCQLAFSVLLEADKAFLAVPLSDLPKYLEPRRETLDPAVVERFLEGKRQTNIDPLRDDARREMLAGMARAGGAGVQTLTLPTGTGKTLLAATWALRHRAERPEGDAPPLVLIVLPYLSIIDQTMIEYKEMFELLGSSPGDLIGYHSLSDRTFAPDLEDKSQDFFLDTWQSSVAITTFDQFCLALLSPRGKHQMRFHHLTDAVIVLDEVQTLPPLLWAPLRGVLSELVQMGTTKVLAMSATQPDFLPKAEELIGDPEAFFQRMCRYRLVLRHHHPMPMSVFLAECRSRLEKWRGRRVLITLDTRRSARMVRDVLAGEGEDVEFLTADVTPADRLEAVQRIKEAKQGIVVSTQCIEAGVDIDMDFVIRDFGPLDSLIQVAGRCNRNGRNERGVVQVVRLQDEDTNRDFASYIYDDVLRDVTYRVLGNRTEVLEEDVYPLTLEYFRGLAESKDTGEAILKAWATWEEVDSVKNLLRGKERPKVSFVVIDRDATLLHDLEQAQKDEDRWERRRAFRRLAPRIARLTVSVYLKEGFDPSRYGHPFPTGAKDDASWFWLLRAEYYTTERGLDLGGASDENEGWGIVI